MHISPLKRLSHPTRGFKDKNVRGVFVAIDLQHNELRQYAPLYKAMCRHVGSRQRGQLLSSHPMCLNGMIDGAKYDFNMTFHVEKHHDRFVRHSRCLTLGCLSDNASEGLSIVFPRKREKIKGMMEEVFKDFLCPEDIDHCVELYFDKVLGVKD